MSSSSTAGDRVVSITFDNSRFKERVAETINAVKNLEQQLKMSNGAQGLSDIGKAAAKVDFAPMASGIEGVSAKFAAMATVGITALSNLTNKAVDAGLSIGESLTIGSAKSGFGEYETNMGSIQTILSNTASDNTNLGDVNKTLEELNEYSDQTVYNFSQMAKNIGTFTAAGVDLETSAGAIKGIANVAAISGSNSEQASAAMYQLSQALATGSVKLMDWNSVVNAGMGGEVFQKSLWETGKALGTITESDVSGTFEEWKKSGNSFRESLADGWLTSEVLTTSLGAFTGDLDAAALEAKGFSSEIAEEMIKTGTMAQNAATEVKTATQLFSTLAETAGSGWAKSFSWILGDFNESKTLFTNINSTLGAMLNKSADTRNAILGGWKVLGGRDDVIQGLKNAFIALQFALKPVIDAFRSLFPKKTGNDLARYSEAFRKFTEKLIITTETAGKIKAVFTGVFSVFKIVTTVFREAG
jgi:tape measure domain-containing protein